jgi:hypothetical protein
MLGIKPYNGIIAARCDRTDTEKMNCLLWDALYKKPLVEIEDVREYTFYDIKHATGNFNSTDFDFRHSNKCKFYELDPRQPRSLSCEEG